MSDFQLVAQFRCAVDVTRRKVERNNRLSARGACDVSGLACGQMKFARRVVGICIEKHPFDEKPAGIAERLIDELGG